MATFNSGTTNDSKSSKKIAVTLAVTIGLAIVIVIALLGIVLVSGPSEEEKADALYQTILTHISNGEYSDAVTNLKALESQEGRTERILACHYDIGLGKLNSGDYTEAISIFQSLDEYRDCAAQVTECQYILAISAMEEKRYDDALAAFEALGDYKDSSAMITQCHYDMASDLLEKNAFYDALLMFKALEGQKSVSDKITQCRQGLIGEKQWNRMRNANIGDTFTFGSYEQDNNLSNGTEDIEWQVLAKDGSRILVVSKYALDCQLYNTLLRPVTWETCSVRKWLNSDFLQAAFTDWQQELIPTVTVYGENNYLYETLAGPPTQDQIFLLSMEEALDYFWYGDERLCLPTPYAIANGAWTSDLGYCYWWLRTPGETQSDASAVFATRGGIHEEGNDVNNPENAIRPAMWIDLDI